MSNRNSRNNILLKTFFLVLILIILIYNPFSARLMTIIAASFFQLDSDNFYHQIAGESSFRSLAYSSKGAIGLGQVLPETAEYIYHKKCKLCLFIPPFNLFISAKYTKHLLHKYDNNWSLALASYNWGETNVDRRIGNLKIDAEKDYRELFSDIPETYSYINKVLKR